MAESSEEWDYIIEPESSRRFYNLTELFKYWDLIRLFVKRDFISLYKQTILGPIWVVLQPVLTTVVFTIVFGKIAQIETGVPSVLFYLLGIAVWTYYADCVTKTSETFIQNQNIFGKVYFPRMVVPISIVLTNLIKFSIQFLLFIAVYSWLIIFVPNAVNFHISPYILLFPFLILALALLGLGTGLIIASLTTRYRDLRFLIQFGVQLGMYITPVVYPLNKVSLDYQWILMLNPMAGILESFKIAMFGSDFAVFNWGFFSYSMVFRW
ncbi:MAG: ABC transporter permease [Crocinitomicaceae bacterium]|nr:ABC transporter permease [Crocinitomicaceae bacterium]